MYEYIHVMILLVYIFKIRVMLTGACGALVNETKKKVLN
jgi:hypothetical protein